MTLRELQRIYEGCGDYVDYVRAGGWSPADRVSAFWASAFADEKRVNYPDFNSMLVMRRGATYPMADSPHDTDPSDERKAATAAYRVMSHTVPRDYLQSIDESAIGSPLCFDFDGATLSAAAIVNALTSYRITRWCESTLDRPGGLRVLEIGAGYGQAAAQLMRRLPIRHYVVCDLPENLFLSSYYLQANFPRKSVAFVRSGERADASAELTFLVPAFLESLQEPFDLIVNSYSFQEMTRASVHEYFAFASRALAPGGLLYSLNAHGKSEIDMPSDYPLDGFQLAGLTPVRRFPHHHVFATNPYEMVLVRAETAQPPASDEFKLHLDAIGGTVQMGVDAELTALVDDFVACRGEASTRRWLSAIGRFWRTKEVAAKERALAEAAETGVHSGVVTYLRGCVAFATGAREDARRDLEQATHELTNGHAGALAALMLSWLARTGGDERACVRWLAAATHALPWLHEEIERWSDGSVLPNRIAEQLRMDLPARHGEPKAVPAGWLFSQIRRTSRRLVTGVQR